MLEQKAIVTATNYSGEPLLAIHIYVVELSLVIELIQQFVVQWVIQEETILMTPEQTVQLIKLLSNKRRECDLSVNEVARRADVDPGTVWRIEQGMIPTPKAESLLAIGKVLGIPPADLFATVGWFTADELPTIMPYLRTKYDQLPDEAIESIESHITAVLQQHSGHHGEPLPTTGVTKER